MSLHNRPEDDPYTRSKPAARQERFARSVLSGTGRIDTHYGCLEPNTRVLCSLAHTCNAAVSDCTAQCPVTVSDCTAQCPVTVSDCTAQCPVTDSDCTAQCPVTDSDKLKIWSSPDLRSHETASVR